MNESHDTRLALLDSARKLFAERGYRGTSIKAITTDAQANLGAVTYHFGTKETLYHEVLRSLMGPLAAAMRAAIDSNVPVLSRIEAVVRTYLGYMYEHWELPSLMLHELSLSGTLPRPIHEAVTAIMGMVSGLIREGQAAGEIVAGDPLMLTASTMAQPLFFLVMRRPLKEIAGINVRERPTQEIVLEHLMSFLRRGLANNGSIE